jgi:hypothetical protein
MQINRNSVAKALIVGSLLAGSLTASGHTRPTLDTHSTAGTISRYTVQTPTPTLTTTGQNNTRVTGGSPTTQ